MQRNKRIALRFGWIKMMWDVRMELWGIQLYSAYSGMDPEDDALFFPYK